MSEKVTKPHAVRRPAFWGFRGMKMVLCMAVALAGALTGVSQSEEAEQKIASAAASPTPAQVEFFEKKVRPLLLERCIKCHGVEKQQGGLRLDSREAMLKGGDSGPVLDLDHPQESLLLQSVIHSPDSFVEMPPDGRLKKEEIAALKKWIDEGAPWPNMKGKNSPKPAGVSPGELKVQFSEEQLAHWAFQPLKPVSIPV